MIAIVAHHKNMPVRHALRAKITLRDAAFFPTGIRLRIILVVDINSRTLHFDYISWKSNHAFNNIYFRLVVVGRSRVIRASENYDVAALWYGPLRYHFRLERRWHIDKTCSLCRQYRRYQSLCGNHLHRQPNHNECIDPKHFHWRVCTCSVQFHESIFYTDSLYSRLYDLLE